MLKKYSKILIANRGEIACRIIKTAHKMGISCVCVYSDADEHSLHVKLADEAVHIGQSPACTSYLDIDKICQAAADTKAQAVHPGYGFLSENQHFPLALEKFGIDFIGPRTEAIKAMANKITAKEVAVKSGVSVVPGYTGAVLNIAHAEEIAQQIGFPIMIKAAAGGGGKGMRIVRSIKEVAQAFNSATNEAMKNFKDGSLFIEKYVELPRHIEVQILGDKFGNIVCLGERECSIQRHNQKVIEESPSPFVTEEIRQKMYEQCISLAKQVNYFSAGTVEFIMDKDKQFYFLEMNTRLQVEHPVTELVTGIDIVEEMIRVSCGEKLRFNQEDIRLNGWAIESRIYAEDPAKNFFPASGRIKYYNMPKESSNVRIDDGVFAGAEVSMFYDPMIAKIITYGKDRMAAINCMQQALSESYVGGITNNIEFLESIFHQPAFIAAKLHTGFISEFYSNGFHSDILTEESIQIFIFISLYIYLSNEYRNWVLCKEIDDSFSVFVDKNEYNIRAKYDGVTLLVIYNHNEYLIQGRWNVSYKLLQVIINNHALNVKMSINKNMYLLGYAGMKAQCFVYYPSIANLSKFMLESKEDKSMLYVEAPISGMLVKLCVDQGEKIEIGQPLCIIEAMKMENIIHAETKGTIKTIAMKEGESIRSGDLLIELE
ncbi:MAG: propionyl-CoA carboxylase subunit alpha [Candidatus Mesenet longicola]|uniref:propionyl-CoA carboxylase n=1 Tax=Candidatus Mesenet longicola TaxID=1892558 RepID=A0A8J3HV69_9RICK|nr:MAG: propionyl-CoA carboxylase subunit alpha [Candidatus Mesenet longicola]GHM59872.1 MAG: propionyl-CoA carboxylase subunit alpha [Candidatus Mesenet longicola]